MIVQGWICMLHQSNQKQIKHTLNHRLNTCLHEPITAVPCTAEVKVDCTTLDKQHHIKI